MTTVFCHVGLSCAFGHIVIISPTLSRLLHGFLDSRTGLSLIHCILYRHWVLKPSLVVTCSVLPPSITPYSDMWRRWSDNTSESVPFCLTNDNNKHHYKNLNRGLFKILIGSCTDLNVDSCSGSNLKYWLRRLLQPKMQTPARVHSGTPGPWLSLKDTCKPLDLGWNHTGC